MREEKVTPMGYLRIIAKRDGSDMTAIEEWMKAGTPTDDVVVGIDSKGGAKDE